MVSQHIALVAKQKPALPASVGRSLLPRRHIEDDDIAESALLEQIRSFPEADSPEDALRALIPPGLDRNKPAPNLKKKMAWFFDQMDKIGDVEGIVGYSEGALVAATLLLEDERRFQDEGIPRHLKMGIFFAGWPALNPRTGGLCLADECDDMVRVPTVHVIGSGDPYLDGSKALYNICDEDTAIFFDHGKGHTLPREGKVVKELGDTVRRTMEKSREFK